MTESLETIFEQLADFLQQPVSDAHSDNEEDFLNAGVSRCADIFLIDAFMSKIVCRGVTIHKLENTITFNIEKCEYMPNATDPNSATLLIDSKFCMLATALLIRAANFLMTDTRYARKKMDGLLDEELPAYYNCLINALGMMEDERVDNECRCEVPQVIDRVVWNFRSEDKHIAVYTSFDFFDLSNIFKL